MSPKLSFLDLPSEIRNAIYLHYVTVEKGYVFNFETGKLAALGSDGKMKPIDHALKFTCKTVAEEMMGLDFQVNPVNFSTGYSDQWRVNAARFHNMQAYFSYAGASMLQERQLPPEDDGGDGSADLREPRESQDENRDRDERGVQDAGTIQVGNVHGETVNDRIQNQDNNHDENQEQDQDEDEDQDGDEDGDGQDEDQNEDENQSQQISLLPCCTDAIVEEVAQRYPEFKPILDIVLAGENVESQGYYLGLLPTLKRQAIRYTLELALQHGSIPEDWLNYIFHAPRQLLALQERFPPWLCCLTAYQFHDVRRQAVISQLNKRQEVNYWKRPHLDGYGDREYTQGKYRFSAAALAIRFLSRLPVSLRMCLRKICLHEDRVSVAYPEMHAQGLIKFCIENPKLHIERRLDLWRNVFQSLWCYDEVDALTFSFEKSWVTNTTDNERGPGLWSLTLTDKVALWMMEALALLPLGMPRESFTLVLDGGEAPEKCSEIFEQIVQRDAVWQAAWETVAANELAEKSFSDKRFHNCYRMDGFPEAMRDMEKNLYGFIQCTFDLRPSIWDVEKETEKFRHLTLEESDALPKINQIFFHPPEPLPSWQDLLAENILPEFFGEQEVAEGEFNYEWHLEEETDDEEIEDDESQPDVSDENYSKVMKRRDDLLTERLAQGCMFFNLSDPTSDSDSDAN